MIIKTINKKGSIYIARTPLHLIGWDILKVLDYEPNGRILLLVKGRGSNNEVREVHCDPRAVPLRMFERDDE